MSVRNLHLLIVSSFLLALTGPVQADLWTLLPSDSPGPGAEQTARQIAGETQGQGKPGLERHQSARLDAQAMARLLAAAPPEGLDGAAPVLLTLPRPEGGLERFAVVESPVMAPELARWLAEQGWSMRTFSGSSLDRPGVSVRLDWGGPDGLHAMVRSPSGSVFIDPSTPGDPTRYAAYRKRDVVPGKPARCELDDSDVGLSLLDHQHGTAAEASAASAASSTNGNLRVYRLAFAVTGDYTQNLAGGSRATAQANLVTIVNRVNVTYERELSVRFVLVGNNADIVYDDPVNDPYDESSAGGMLAENQANLDSVIGPANYDIGHVIYNGGSGIASIGVPCRNSFKARGVSGALQATGDALVVEMVAHELGHQFSAFHTFNSPLGSCSGQRTANSAWAPGSGTTIMSYTGICGADNIQTFSDDYFHGGSLEDMLDFTAGAGSCASQVPIGNSAEPLVSAAGGATLPIGTPFELDVTSASDADGDALTFTWEQLDPGVVPATLADGDLGNNPLFRSLPPSSDSGRVFRGEALGETLPTTSRTLTFRVTARDNNPAGGRIGQADIAYQTDAGSGPFDLTFPDGGESLRSGVLHTVTWDVAGTNAPPINTTAVDILLSTDGGLSYDTVLASNVPNDGARQVAFPAVSSATARVRVKARGNVYFTESDDTFQLNAFEQCVDADLVIPQGVPTTAELVVGGQTDPISDLDVRLEVDYPTVGILRAELRHVETGTVVELFRRPGYDEVTDPTPGQIPQALGCDRADIDAVFDDDAATPAEDACAASPDAFTGRLSPLEALAGFNGESLNGTWRLTVAEIGFSITRQPGTEADYLLAGFCLQAPLEAQTPPPPPPPPPPPQPPTILKSGFETGEGGA